MFVKAILCNWMVLLAIVAAAILVDDRQDRLRLRAIFIFFAQGFEHSVVGHLHHPDRHDDGAKTTVAQWWLWNQIPVTLGNLVGGAIFTGLALYIALKPRTAAPHP